MAKLIVQNETILNLLIWTPVIGAFALPVVGKVSPRLRNLLALAGVLVSLVCSLALYRTVMAGTVVTVAMETGFGSRLFHADCLAVFMATVSSLVGAIIVFYSWGYISHYDNQNEYYFLVVLFLGSMMGLVFSANLILLYVFWEITALTSWRLIGFFREPQQVVRADKAFMMTFFGAVLMLLGFIMIFDKAGTFDMIQLRERFSSECIPNLAVVLILAGLLSKSATLPLQTWLPDAGVAPSPVTALLHAAVLVKIGVYVYARLLIVTFAIDPMWNVVVPAVAGASAILAAGAAMIETDLKRIIAFSTISQIGFIFLGLAIGRASEMAIAGGLLYILMHGFAKGGLFLCAGIVEQNTHTKDITRLGGLVRTMPVTAVSFLICAFSVMGIPPFGGFFSKYMVIAGAAKSSPLWITLIFVVGAFMTIIYLARVFVMVFMGESKGHEEREGSVVMVGSVALLALLSIVSGLYIGVSSDFAQAAVKQMLGGGQP
ncbi:MAG: NADH-quinone oxidoreductase subunit L [Verrucomicrobiae bacterium]|nr:NADH-quinone oxidoreductase subunit L [Verrucomicrobiae bacterium]